MKERKNFENFEYKILTLDIVKMYPSVDIEFTIKHIINKIYKNPINYFEEIYDENDNFVYPD